MAGQFDRTIRLIGEAAQSRIAQSAVVVVGLGGVGGYVVEALARAGVGRLLLVDGDTVDITNLNRQILATHETVGQPKAAVAKARVLSIQPACAVDARAVFYNEETADAFDFSGYDMLVDAIDQVTAKLLLIERAARDGVPVVSAMGAGNKLDPMRFVVAPIEQTTVCPLARVMRRALKARNLSVRAVYSTEVARKPLDGERSPGSIAYVPAACGLALAADVLRRLGGF